ncbi:MAG: hypothetical protein JXJ04_20230 [Spirochaetales bacterium]|nr:hypothetical protein [Spirochaetales bacterium]
MTTIRCHCEDEEKLFGHTKTCAVRLCGFEKKQTTCADCDDFGGSKVREFRKYDETFRQKQESLRK